MFDKKHLCTIHSSFSFSLVKWIIDVGGKATPYHRRWLASFFFGARIWLGTILCRFSINYFSGLGLKIRVWVRVRVRVRVRVMVRVRVVVRVSVVIWSV